MKIEQSNNSNPPKKYLQLDNPSIVPKLPKWFGYAVASPWFSNLAWVPSRTASHLQVYCYQDPKNVKS